MRIILALLALVVIHRESTEGWRVGHRGRRWEKGRGKCNEMCLHRYMQHARRLPFSTQMFESYGNTHGTSVVALPEVAVTVAVLEGDITMAAQAGDLEQLREWGLQGVRVITGEPLCAAAECGSWKTCGA